MRHGTFATSMVCNATASQQVCAALKFSFALKRRAGRFLLALAGLVCLFGAAPAAGGGAEMGNIPRAATWVTDGPVYAIVRTADKVYIGGTFHNVGPSGGTWTPRNHIAALDASTGAATVWDPNANGTIGIEIPSGAVYDVAGNPVVGNTSSLYTIQNVTMPVAELAGLAGLVGLITLTGLRRLRKN